MVAPPNTRWVRACAAVRAIAKPAIPNNRCTMLCRIDTTLWACGYLPRLVSFFNMPVSTAAGRCCSPA
jgi:hypothetical protein